MIRKVHISIDPGIRGTGIAVWDADLWKHRSNIYPIQTAVYEPPQDEDWVLATSTLWKWFNTYMDENDLVPLKFHCEFPHYMQSDKGVAATNKGLIYKLSFLVGTFNCMALERGIVLDPILVRDWKGQLPKEAVIKRIKRIAPDIEKRVWPTSHDWDAIGIGLYAQKLFKVT